MPYKYIEIKRKLKKMWFIEKRKGKGSHVIFSNDKITLPVPNHPWKDISPWVESKIIKWIWLSKDEFRDL